MTTMWVCLACGKRSWDRYGDKPIDCGWDASCFMNAVAVDASKVHGPLVDWVEKKSPRA